MFDSGADASLIRREVFEREFPGVKPSPTGRFTLAHDGMTREPTVGAVLLRVEVEKGKRLVHEMFEVVEHLNQEAIFGAPGLENHSIDVEMRPPREGGSRVKFATGKDGDIHPGGINLVDGP